MFPSERVDVLRTPISRTRRLTTALVLCGAVLLVPLITLLSAPGATPEATSGTGGTAARHVAAAHTHPAPSWELVSATRVATTTAPPTTVPPPTTTDPPPTTTDPPTTTTTLDPPPTTTTAPPAAAATQVSAASHSIEGQGTWYGAPTGTCASPTLPFGIELTVTNDATGASTTCLVDDREADASRVIDLAPDTFSQIAPLSEGVIEVTLTW